MTVFQTRVSGIASARSCCPSATVTRSVGPRPSARWLHQHRASDRSQPAACAALAPIRWLGAASPAPPPARSPRAARCGPGSIIDRWISWRLWIDAVADAVVPIRAVSGAVRCKGWDRVKRDNHWRDVRSFLYERSSRQVVDSFVVIHCSPYALGCFARCIQKHRFAESPKASRKRR